MANRTKMAAEIFDYFERMRRSGQCLSTLDVEGIIEKYEEQSLARVNQLEALINHPETDDWFKGVQVEAAHQVERWGSKHDEGKHPLDWFWLIGYLSQKAAMSELAGDKAKALHHTISTAAVLLNWHRRMCGTEQNYQPGMARDLLKELTDV